MVNTYRKQSGVVSLFVVIFATLLMTVVTVSFVKIMISSQQQATVNDLSQSANDSALAGVEDSKRAILRLQSLCDSDPSSAACTDARSKLDSLSCNVATGSLSDVAPLAPIGNEVPVQTGSATNSLDQAYTCTKVDLNTVDYKGSLLKNEQKIIPLRGVGDFDTIKIQWFSDRDIYPSTAVNRQSATATDPSPMITESAWVSNRPPILRVQQINIKSSSDLNSFDSDSGNSNTVFLYPTDTVGNPVFVFKDRDIRRDLTSSGIISSSCVASLATGGYACSTQLTMPTIINANNKTAFLRLSAIYNKANYRITLFNGVSPVEFKEVQPSIDSTGRANDLYRRVQARVELSTDFVYPNAAVYTHDTFCKDFLITDDSADYNNNCTP